MKNRDLRLGLILMTILLVLYAISYTFPKSVMSETHTSAAFFPRIVLIVAMGLTSILIITNIWRKEASSGYKGIEREQKFRVLGSMALALGFALGAVFIGTFVSIFLLIVAMMALWGVRNRVTILLIALLTPIFVYVIFTKILLVQFPTGVLF
jgi:putative tricarboxylic transport membrane protein